jgi:hypothetical protein
MSFHPRRAASQPTRVIAIYWVALDVRKPIEPAFESNWIFGDEPSYLRVIPTGAVIHQSRIGIALAAGKSVARARAAGAVAEGIVAELLDNVSARIS